MIKASPSSDKSLLILHAAGKVLSECGFAGATISRVVAEAKVARGLIHYYFKNKEDMLAKVLRANLKNSVEMLRPIFDKADSAEAFARMLVREMKMMLKNNPNYFNLFVEGVAVSRHSDAVRSALDSLYAQFRESLQAGLEAMYSKGYIDPKISISGLAMLLTAMLDGLGTQFVSLKGSSIDKDNWQSLEKAILLLTRRVPE